MSLQRRNTGRFLVLTLLTVGASSTWVLGAQARPPNDERPVPAAGPREVEILIGGASAGEPELEAILGELLQRLGLRSRVRYLSEIDDRRLRAVLPDGTAARVGIILSHGTETRVLVTDADGGHLDAFSTSSDGPREVVREELAHRIQAAVEALLLPGSPDRPLTPPPVAGEAHLDKAQESPTGRRNNLERSSLAGSSASSPWALDFTTRGGMALFSKDTPAIAQVGATLAIAKNGPFRPSLTASGSYSLPVEVGNSWVKARVSTVGFRLIPTLTLWSTHMLALDIGVGGGIDVISISPQSNRLPASRLWGPPARVCGVGSALGGLEIRISGSATAGAKLGIDADFSKLRWVTEEGGAHESILAPSHWRPFGWLGLSFTAVGRGRFNNQTSGASSNPTGAQP